MFEHKWSTVSLVIDARGVANLTLNRPDRHNAYNDELVSDCAQCMLRIASEAPAVVVIRGQGTTFQAGADLDWIESLRNLDTEQNIHASQQTADLISSIDDLEMPVLCLVQGGCYGGGTGIVAACDVVVAVRQTRFAIAEARWGLTAGIIVPQLIDAIGYRNLRRFALTAEVFDAQVAHAIGLVHEIAESLEQGNDTINHFVELILANEVTAVSATKRTLQEFRTMPEDYSTLIREHAMVRLSDAAGRGLRAYRTQRRRTST